MIAKVLTVVFLGVEAKLVEIQTHIGNGLPSFNIVGLADRSVIESKERIRTAFAYLKIPLPPKRITVNLSPSNLQKEGSHFDLPIALSLLISLGHVSQDSLKNYIVLGELSLDSNIVATKGTLAALVTAVKNKKNLIFPLPQITEVGLFSTRLKLVPCSNIREIIQYLNGILDLPIPKIIPKRQAADNTSYLDLKDIIGQETAKKALEIAAGGGHNMLMIGPPGIGKTTIANAIRGILPPLTKKEILEVSTIYSIAGMLGENNLITERPFRSPHHSTSLPALIGGGKKIQPGEVTLATKGILFLDELAEFNRNTLDSLREPLESGKINISRANERISMPCDFQLIAATNPCYCGYYSVPGKECVKAPLCAENYQSKLSGPLLDRIDLIIELSEARAYSAINSNSPSTSEVLKKVTLAREIQAQRYKNKPFKLNAKMDGETLNTTTNIIKLNPIAWNLLNRFANKFKISLRTYNKIIKLSQTICDLKGKPNIDELEISEAISYRQADYNHKAFK